MNGPILEAPLATDADDTEATVQTRAVAPATSRRRPTVWRALLSRRLTAVALAVVVLYIGAGLVSFLPFMEHWAADPVGGIYDPPRVGRPLCVMCAEPGEEQRCRVDEHVACVRQQRERSGNDAADRLADEHKQGQREGEQQSTFAAERLRVAVDVGMTVICVMVVRMVVGEAHG